jgi:hypothetical protein
MNAPAGYSVQQIKFEFLSYIKEFGASGLDWFIGCANEPSAHGERADIVPDNAIWICKPALSERAARMVHDHMVSRHQVRIAPGAGSGNWIYMYRDGPGAGVLQPDHADLRQKQVETDRQLS